MFTGFTDVVDINIPFKLSNPTGWHKPPKQVFEMVTNPDFETLVAKALKDRGLDKTAPILLMCRSGGTRGAPSSKMLEGKGYKNIYVITDGFEGGKIKKGDQKNWRLKNGWKNSNLPWSYKLNKDKMFFKSPELQEKMALIKTSKIAIGKFAKTLKGELKKTVKEGGLDNAIEVCSKKAGPIAKKISKETGLTISRISNKNRNPNNAPNEWQKKILEKFALKHTVGADLRKVAFSNISEVKGKKTFNFVKAIPTGKLCLKCHGATVDAKVEAKLKELYPDDLARGFKKGDLRGAFIVSKNLN
jgi:rhodanese-related sulfurtransferase